MQNSGRKRYVGSDHQQAQNVDSGLQWWAHLQHWENDTMPHEIHLCKMCLRLCTDTHCPGP